MLWLLFSSVLDPGELRMTILGNLRMSMNVLPLPSRWVHITTYTDVRNCLLAYAPHIQYTTGRVTYMHLLFGLECMNQIESLHTFQVCYSFHDRPHPLWMAFRGAVPLTPTFDLELSCTGPY